MESETLQVKTTQRVTDSGKRTKFRVVTVVGDRKGHVGLGVGKSDELKPAMDYAVRERQEAHDSDQDRMRQLGMQMLDTSTRSR